MTDYEKHYEEFWKEIIENEDGSLNLDQIKRELFDYSGVMEEATKAYSSLTGGRITKPNTKASEVISQAESFVGYANE